VCEVIGEIYGQLSRRDLVRNAGVGAVAATALTSGLSASSAVAAAPKRKRARGYRTKVVLLGTTGGPLAATPAKAGISSAVVVGSAVYLVDCGEGFRMRYLEAGLAPPSAVKFGPRSMYSSLHGIFLTHLHSDHVCDYPATQLLIATTAGASAARPLQVFGPGNRGSLPDVKPPGRPAPVVMNPADPTPGTAGMSDYLFKAFATDHNDRMRDFAAADPRDLIKVHDIALPAGVTPSSPPPTVTPFKVFEDNHVRVTATLVDHGQMFPSFGYRFDTDDGSIVFSGDTAPSDNLVALAKNTDVLVHEALDIRPFKKAFGPTPYDPSIQINYDHLIKSHTGIHQVGKVAERAGAKTLVLNHLVPFTTTAARWRQAHKGFSGRLVVGHDLLEVGVGRRRSRR
jgi:ribonuclease BN (tRNA processing enzyme)